MALSTQCDFQDRAEAPDSCDGQCENAGSCDRMLAAVRRLNDLSEEFATEAAVEADKVDRDHKQFVLTYVQPGLAGFIDGSISTLAPIFAVAFATQNSFTTFMVGLAASLGAGISMGFTEYASDDGVVSGRGSPVARGIVTGLMTTLGGLGHTLPYLISHFAVATWIAIVVVAIELAAIAYVQKRFMGVRWIRSLTQTVIGGSIVVSVGIGIGSVTL
ncbi:MAG: hypothetical protein Rhirs2KO_00480 [Rhizobiaceae bacterium]